MQYRFAPVMLAVNHIQQRTSGECLAACSAMALNYLGYRADYQHLINLLRIRPLIGTPFFNIRKLSKLGVKVTYKQGTLAEIHQCLTNNYPCIVAVQTEQLPYWNYTNSHHVIVAIGRNSEFIYVNDPEFADAPIAVNLGDFDLAWLEQESITPC